MVILFVSYFQLWPKILLSAILWHFDSLVHYHTLQVSQNVKKAKDRFSDKLGDEPIVSEPNDDEHVDDDEEERLVDITMGEDKFWKSKQLIETSNSAIKKKSSGKSRPRTNEKSLRKLAAGWKIVNERLKDIEALEKRNKS